MTTTDFNKIGDIFQCKLLLEDDTEFIIPMREDGYIFATGLCKVAKKQVSKWKNMKETKLLIAKLESKKSTSTLIEVYKGQTTQYNQGTWIHPDLGLHLAQWCSPSFSLQVSKWIRELVITGKVERGNEKNEKELKEEYDKLLEKLKNKDEELKHKDNIIISQENETKHLSKKYDKLYQNHQSFLRRKELYKLNKGDCVYLVNMLGKTDHKDVLNIKVGFTGNITNRICGFRTSSPFCKLLYLMYSPQSLAIENNMKVRYEKELEPNNREFITGVQLEELVSYIKVFADSLRTTYIIETDEELDKFNGHIVPLEKIQEITIPTHIRCGGITHLTEDSRMVDITNYYKHSGNKNGIARLCKECYIISTYGDKRKRRKTVTIPSFNIETHKWCNLCSMVKKQNDFYKASNTKDGLNANCKTCKLEQKKKRLYKLKEDSTKCVV